MGDRYLGDRYVPRAGDAYNGDHYDDSSRQHYHDAPGYTQRNEEMYHFRGAAEGDSYRPRNQPDSYRHDPHVDRAFDFQPINQPPPPRFPPADTYAPRPQESRHERHQRHEPPGKRRRNQERADTAGHGGRGGNRGYPRGRGGFYGPKAAHSRDLLRGNPNRSITPEQLPGMNEGHVARFRAEGDLPDSDEAELDEDQDAGEVDEDGAPARKRTKTGGASEATVPKWSNPDPYTVLPPVTEGAALPKKDIVKVIRKAKVDTNHAAATKAANEGDFISFNFDAENGDDDMSEDEPPPGAPTGPRSFSHLNHLHPDRQSTADLSTVEVGNDAWRQPPPIARDPNGPPPPPPGTIIPTDAEIRQALGDNMQSNKRKRAPRERQDRDIVAEWEADGISDPIPWRTDYSVTSSPAMKLHMEICDFHDFVKAHGFEEHARRDVIARIQDAFTTFNNRGDSGRDVEIRSFGSFAAGLYLPTADMDLVAVSRTYMSTGRATFCQKANTMHALGHHLTKLGIIRPGTFAAVARAKVPIIKFVDHMTGLKVDISFENDSGLKAVRTVQEWKLQYPSMSPIVLLIKQMLAMRGQNEVYNGGLGGFSIICLVVSMLQNMPELQNGETMNPDEYMGRYLMEFLDLYGNKLNIINTGIYMDPPGYFDKIKNPVSIQNANRLTIIDPNRNDNDISGGTRNIDLILDCFRHAHATLQRRLSEVLQRGNSSEGILGCIWGGNYSAFMAQREKLRKVGVRNGYDGGNAAEPNVSHAYAPTRGDDEYDRNAYDGYDESRGHERSNPYRDHYRTRDDRSRGQSPPTKKRKQPQAPSYQPPRQQQRGLPPKPTAPSEAKKPAKKRANAGEGIRERARQFKKAHPEIEGVPDKLKKKTMQKLKEKHGIK